VLVMWGNELELGHFERKVEENKLGKALSGKKKKWRGRRGGDRDCCRATSAGKSG